MGWEYVLIGGLQVCTIGIGVNPPCMLESGRSWTPVERVCYGMTTEEEAVFEELAGDLFGCLRAFEHQMWLPVIYQLDQHVWEEWMDDLWQPAWSSSLLVYDSKQIPSETKYRNRTISLTSAHRLLHSIFHLCRSERQNRLHNLTSQ